MLKLLYKSLSGLGLLGVVAFYSFAILMFVGWVKNIIHLYHYFNTDLTITWTGKLILHAVGVFFYPLGAYVGWFPLL